MSGLPFGADTLVVPFELRAGSAAPVIVRMSRLRPRGELFRHGVVPAGHEDRGLADGERSDAAEERDG